MAEQLLRNMIPDEYRERIEISSAGVSAINGRKATTYAQLVAREEGVDLSRHRATPLLLEEIDRADLILTMESGHQKVLLSLSPGAGAKTHLLKQYANRTIKDGSSEEEHSSGAGNESGRGVWDIKDPYGATLKVYRECRDEIKEGLKKALPRIIEELVKDGQKQIPIPDD